MLMAAAGINCVICLVGAMDRLWFHQIILFSEPSSSHLSDDPKKQEKSSDNSSENASDMISSEASVITCPLDESSSQEISDDHEERERPTRLNLVASKTRSHSSSPIFAQERSRNPRRFQKTMSCKSLVDLELEEVKGFMDLGFTFRKENLSKRIVNLIPGLLRIDASLKNKEEEDDDDDGEEKYVMRPYLSEAWIIRRPDSPLLNLRIPRVSKSEDMKKHLKYWAQTVASAILQES